MRIPVVVVRGKVKKVNIKENITILLAGESEYSKKGLTDVGVSGRR